MRFWVAVLSTLGVALLALESLGRTSPGPLTSVHQREAGLSGDRDCAQCHGGVLDSMTDSCLECHAPIEAQLESGEGLHGILAKESASSCARCHSEHHGPSFAITNERSFALAGTEGPEGFDHSLVGFPMEGKHLELACTECHANADVEVLPEGERRFLGLDWDCATCHEDPHEGRMLIACAQCHGQEAFDVYDSFGHEEFLPLVGGHADLACTECHERKGPRSLEVIGTRFSKLAARQCQACHESPHDQAFVANVASLVSERPAASCVACHAAEHETFHDERLDVTPELHAASGFALATPHGEATCAQCHATELEGFEARYPGRAADDCAECHDDPHGGQFAEGPFAQPGCVACHGREHFEPHSFTRELHASAFLPLTGKHADVECNVCHADPPEGEPRVFRGTDERCEQCHTDAHDAYFDAEHGAELAALPQGTCARCHDDASFSEVPAERFDHAQWTGLAVEGAHAQVDCTACHVRDELPDEHGRTLGRIAEIHGAYEGCVTCHVDPHEGDFDLPGLPADVNGMADCARCHEQSSFRSSHDDFEHGTWTGFPLEGAHARADCAACHAPLMAPDELGRTWERAKSALCADCHADPHAGQFRQGERTDCARCHASAGSFAAIAFDHERDARFALGKAHRKVACAECHETWPLAGGGEVVRYRPLRMECTDCHGAHHEQVRAAAGRKG